jgi:hypothetical protein
MMTLRLRRCVGLFVCLSLLVSACSPDKSSKAGNKVSSKANEFARNTKIDKDSVEKIADHAPSAVNNNNVHPVGFWNRELGKVGGVSITPTRLAIGTVAVLGTATVLYVVYKWYKRSTEPQPLTVPPPGSSLDPSVEETNAIEETNKIRKDMYEIVDKNRGCVQDTTARTTVETNSWSDKAARMFDIVSGKITDETITRKKRLTPAIAKTAVESAEKEFCKIYNKEYSEGWWGNFLIAQARIAQEVKTNETMLPKNQRNDIKKFVSTEVMAVRLVTLRKMGSIWDEEGRRMFGTDARKLTIKEGVALNTIMATLEERLLNFIMAINIYDIRKQQFPKDLTVGVF